MEMRRWHMVGGNVAHTLRAWPWVDALTFGEVPAGPASGRDLGTSVLRGCPNRATRNPELETTCQDHKNAKYLLVIFSTSCRSLAIV